MTNWMKVGILFAVFGGVSMLCGAIIEDIEFLIIGTGMLVIAMISLATESIIEILEKVPGVLIDTPAE